MKKLYALYFKNSNDRKPDLREFICVDNCGRSETTCVLIDEAVAITNWMLEYPNGKVELVWE